MINFPFLSYPLTAYVYGIYGNYNLAFFLAGLPPIVAASTMLMVMRFQKNEKPLHSCRERAHSIVENGKFSPLDELNACNGNGTSNGNGLLSPTDNGEKIHLLEKSNNVSDTKDEPQKTTVVA